MLDRYRGALLGLATGDALGTTLEFSKRGAFEPIDVCLPLSFLDDDATVVG